MLKIDIKKKYNLEDLKLRVAKMHQEWERLKNVYQRHPTPENLEALERNENSSNLGYAQGLLDGKIEILELL
jgi:hypothetical protein